MGDFALRSTRDLAAGETGGRGERGKYSLVTLVRPIPTCRSEENPHFFYHRAELVNSLT